MDNDSDSPSAETIFEGVQDALTELYSKGFAAGRLAGYAEGIEAARTQLLSMPLEPKSSTPNEQEARSGVPLTTPIVELSLSQRAHNCLKREGLHTIGDVLRFSEKDSLFNIRNFGPKAGRDVKAALEELGYVIDLGQY